MVVLFQLRGDNLQKAFSKDLNLANSPIAKEFKEKVNTAWNEMITMVSGILKNGLSTLKDLPKASEEKMRIMITERDYLKNDVEVAEKNLTSYYWSLKLGGKENDELERNLIQKVADSRGALAKCDEKWKKALDQIGQIFKKDEFMKPKEE